VSYPSDKIKKKVQQTAQRNTLLVSALWHGFYPGYFVSFFHWMMYLRILQELFRIRQNNKNI
jgi:lysophospholipid acyltransferase